jgi:hypothetical protein
MEFIAYGYNPFRERTLLIYLQYIEQFMRLKRIAAGVIVFPPLDLPSCHGLTRLAEPGLHGAE